MKKKIQKIIDGLNGEVSKMEKALAVKKATNQITEDARAEVEGRIEQLRGFITELESLRDAAAEGDEDKSEQLAANVKEVMARVAALEGSASNAAAKVKKINNSKEYQSKFMEMVKNSLTRDDFKENLKKLAAENSITITDGDLSELLPAAVLNEVNDVFLKHRHRLLELVDWTGLSVFKALWETDNELGHHWPSEMLGETASSDPKTEQNLTFEEIVIRPAFEYKTISVDKEVIKASENDGGAFIRYIVRELLNRLLTWIETLILTGNGKNFIAPAAKTATLDPDGNPVLHVINYLPYNAGVVAIVTRTVYAELLHTVQTQSNYQVVLNADEIIKGILGVEEVILTPPTFQTTGNQIGVFFLNPDEYKMVGDKRPDQYEDFNLSWNRKEYLMEMWVGGGCITPEFISLESGE